MDQVDYFEDLFELITVYRKIVLLMLKKSRKDDVLLGESGFLKNDIKRVLEKFEA